MWINDLQYCKFTAIVKMYASRNGSSKVRNLSFITVKELLIHILLTEASESAQDVLFRFVLQEL